MLELYHWEPNGASARVLITLKEKGLDFQSRYVDVLSFEQHAPAILELNETGEVPILVRDGEAYTESSYICEYLDEAFAAPALMPADPLGRWRVRVWQKLVDDTVAASAADLAWHAYGAPGLEGRNVAVEAAVAKIPSHERREVWSEAVAGLTDERLEASRGRLKTAVERMEAELAKGDWLAGDGFTLADVALYPYVNYLPKLMAEDVNAAVAPRTMGWLQRVGERPAVKAALVLARTPDPYAVAAPGPEHVRWG